MKINNPIPSVKEFTHEGARATRAPSPLAALRRSVLSCFLWEKEFYEDGEEIADRIVKLAGEVPISDLSALAIEARKVFHLRHVPLLLLSVLASRARGLTGPLTRQTIGQVISRADELTEFLAIHAKREGVQPNALKKKISAQMKLGLADAFHKFDEYQLAKYDRAGAIRLRDVLFLCHAKPQGPEQDALWKRLIANELVAPDTWEVALSAGADKKETFTRLISEGKLGYLALLRNLRNMVDAGVDRDLMVGAILARKGAERVFPFRYVAAARHAPSLEPALDQALLASINDLPPLGGLTVVLVDTSGSMEVALSAKSDLTRRDAASTLASIIPSSNIRTFAFADSLVEVPSRKGMAGIEALNQAPSGGTRLIEAVNWVTQHVKHDRLIVITDEQAAGSSWHWRGYTSPLLTPTSKAYMINVASAKNGISYKPGWTHLDGFSENIIRFIHEMEKETLQ